MSLEEIDHTGYVKFVWPAKFSSSLGTIYYSDQFKIDNLENVTFNIGLKVETSGHISLWVQKSNPEVVSAMIRVMVGDKMDQVETDEWTDRCNILSNFNMSGISIRQNRDYDYKRGHYYYFYVITIVCEIFWRDKIKNRNFEHLLFDMQKFYKSEKFSDVTIIIDNVKIPAHKLILSTYSLVFSRMLQSDMKEAKEGVINIKGFEPEIILDMLHYCYRGETKASSDAEVALRLLEAADMYQITKLKEICIVTLMNNMSVDNVLRIIDLADDYNIIDLRTSALKFIVDHIDRKMFMSSEFRHLCWTKQDLMLKAINAGVYMLTID